MSKLKTRPTTHDIRLEISRLIRDGQSSEFEVGVLAALQWVIGDKATLQKPGK